MGLPESSVSKSTFCQALRAKVNPQDPHGRENQLLQIVPRVHLALCTCRHTQRHIHKCKNFKTKGWEGFWNGEQTITSSLEAGRLSVCKPWAVAQGSGQSHGVSVVHKLSAHISCMSATDVQVHMAVIRKRNLGSILIKVIVGFCSDFSQKLLQMTCYQPELFGYYATAQSMHIHYNDHSGQHLYPFLPCQPADRDQALKAIVTQWN